MRARLKFDKTAENMLRELAAYSGNSRAEVIRDALSYLYWTYNHMREGHTFYLDGRVVYIHGYSKED